MSQWLGIVIAAAALALSLYTLVTQELRGRRAERRADMTVSFHWLTSRAYVELEGREPVMAGYHLVLSNRGPAAATDVDVTLRDESGRQLRLLDVERGELPLAEMAAGARYPIPWAYEPFRQHSRRFEATLTWADGNGNQQRVVPLRRGQLPPAP
ncbi:hypothetical protein [Barrientosiimonas endolithica]|uniref:DUF2393 domain-containing protein n=1 Tax=Barrientosiimonas endolithica TaxID=1535208 RepID=A0ABN6YKZ4_9MICO|nr:hypothetical protein [Barrientosiimonas endolithica]BDZ57656.1 hypothetical protein GCM10025872_13130 [Barrientosiimonas endolithica]